jgi:hypothetical protein
MSAPPSTWSVLRDAGIAQGEEPALPARASSPWYVRAMLGAAAWLAAAFFLPWVVLLIGERSLRGWGYVLLGLALCAGAGAMFRALARAAAGRKEPQDFQHQLALVLGLSGQGAVWAGLFFFGSHAGPGVGALFLIIAGFELAVVWAVPDFLHRVLAALWGGIALSIALFAWNVHALAPALLAALASLAWLREGRLGDKRELVRAAAYGLTLAFLGSQGWQMAGSAVGLASFGTVLPASAAQAMAIGGRLLLAVVWLFAVWSIAGRYRGLAPSVRKAVLLSAVVAAVLAGFAPAVLAGLLVTVLGFAHGNRLVLGLGLAAVAVSLSWTYYNLDATLLVKSAVLAASGVAALAGAYWLSRREGAGHA